MRRAVYEIVHGECTAQRLVIRDLGGRMAVRSVTNDAENVVADLAARGHLTPGRRLFYYDSAGDLDEIRVVDGRFDGFSPGPGRPATVGGTRADRWPFPPPF